MTIADALKLLNLSGEVTAHDVTRAYHEAAKRYHPDVNPAGIEMMKMVNEAYATLEDWEGFAGTAPQPGEQVYSDAVNDALRVVVNLDGLDVEICGSWVWVGGNTYPYRAELKTAGFRFAGAKKMWYFRPEGWQSRSHGKFTIDEIRQMHGSTTPTIRPYVRVEEERL